ncbi:MAG: Crp/Fnr family transcriptional regulator [Acidobacteria bacterium]|nr:Crp/Fnr family transcriptional regulator [Acidobacteriota bacterium]
MAPKPTRAFDPKTFLLKIGAGRTIVEYKKKRTIFSQGDAADAIFYVQKGKVKLTVVSKQGKIATVAILTADDFFGEASMAGQSLRMETATALTDCVLLRIEKSAMTRVLNEQKSFSAFFMAHLLSRSIQYEEALVDQLFNSSERRLARVLMLLTQFGKEGKTESVPKINQETLAQMVGTTRERVSHFMNKFRKLGLIEYNGGLRVHSSLINVVLRD